MMAAEVERFFDGETWNRRAVMEAQRTRATANARKLGWEPTARSFLSDPLDEAFVEEFERSHQTSLPFEYRSFLLQVGDGGDGPGLYMRPLGAPLDDSVPWEAGTIHRSPEEPNELLHRPFIYRNAVFLPPEEASPETTAGALFLFDHGCAMWDLLVVTGEEKGEIWLDRLADGEGFAPALDGRGQRVGFAQHYCNWLLGP